MAFIVINENFQCKNCNTENFTLKGSCRNHCTKCLYSLHLDESSPGDRASNCKNLMEPIKVYQNGKKGWMIIHKCKKCRKEIANKSALDDDFTKIIEISTKG